jgi:hypothetical protein
MAANGSETEEVTWNDSDDGSVKPNVDMDGGQCQRPEIGGRNDMVVTIICTFSLDIISPSAESI